MFIWIIFWFLTVFQAVFAAENETFPLLSPENETLPTTTESTILEESKTANKSELPTTMPMTASTTTESAANLTKVAQLIFTTMASMAVASTSEQAKLLATTVPATETPSSTPATPPTSSSTLPTATKATKQYFPGRDPQFFIGKTSTTIKKTRAHWFTTPPTTTTMPPTTPKFETYSPVPMPEMDNNVFQEFARLSKLTGYMIVDPRFAEDYASGRLSNMSKILYMVYGDVVKHIFASEALTQRQPPPRRNRIRYRMKSLNDKPPKSCTEAGRETFRMFCPFSYGYQWWDCILPDEVCDGVPHCGLGDDEDPKMCLYFKAAVAKLEASHKGILNDLSAGRQLSGKDVEVYDPERDK